MKPANARYGFTMLELLITLLIIGILAMIIYPGYLTWRLKANRSDAMSTLAADQTILERCFAQTFTYNGACAALPALPQASPQGFYSINITNRTATTYTLTATATGTQTRDTMCNSMSVDQTNQRTAASNAGVAQTTCWNP